ncbi:hypothetical protein L0665_10170 [Methanogenium marinum]|uniref:Uncharacterized protein n=1 Tax=Methanogenium marinum TaxID=348610 RepID=A0A9Q4KUB1_9EURY|nr:hypothetical protein [Methanogenium marinum]MDE4908972.1 hypothetical protein [Methanogenium marinum]
MNRIKEIKEIKKIEETQKGTNTATKPGTKPDTKTVLKPTLKNTPGQPQARVETSSITEEINGNKTRQIMPDEEMGTCNPQTQNR